MNIPIYGWVSLGTLFSVVVIAGLAKATDPDPQRLTGKALFAVRSYIDSALRFKKQAVQDADLTQRLTDICFAIAYINAARVIASDALLEQKCGTKVDELHVTLRALQRECLNELDK